MKFWNVTENGEGGQPEIRIHGDIQMDKSLWAILFDLPEQTAPGIREDIKKLDGKDITVWINSNGGECFAASVIYTALREHRGKVTVKIDGTAISAASVIAMAGDEVLMSPTSIMMVHNPLTRTEGEAKDMAKAIEILSEVKETILNAYCKKCKKPRDEISKLMDEETWMSAQTAVEMGFADGILGEEEAEIPVTDGLVRGARMVYNRVNTVDTRTFLNLLRKPEESNQLEFAKIRLEKQRFGGYKT